MLTLEQMIWRLAIAVVLGAIIGLERELVRKEAGIKTNMLVVSGAAIFTMIGLNLNFLNMLANVVVGVGFLGAGIIFKEEHRVRGLTTAAAVWFGAAIGVLAGLGWLKFAAIVTISLMLILFLLRNFALIRKEQD